jgi:tetraacyldisaccharide 4'-kinase
MGLFDPSTIHELMSGRRRGVMPAAARALLRAAEVPYACVVAHRNRRFDRGRAVVNRVGVPVISVGNVTTGGTGKTPMVAWLARWFRRRDARVTLISRGYKADEGALNDEALELERQLPDVPHLQNPDRIAAARTAIEELECQLILLDDAFQHRRIHRDLDIVLLDAVEPFGFGHLLPRGLLRESPRGLSRADVVVLSRADAIEPRRREEVYRQARTHAPRADWVEVSHQPRRLSNATGQVQTVGELNGPRIAAFCGIGNPQGFRHTLACCGIRPVGFRSFPDHHRFQSSDIDQLAEFARSSGADALVCTGKDLVKIGVDRIHDVPLWAVVVEVSVDKGLDALESRLGTILEHIH